MADTIDHLQAIDHSMSKSNPVGDDAEDAVL
jgi:hypothetical protein